MPQINKARYVIVRVDDSLMCPSHYENIKNDYVCVKGSCGNCRYGDTKEQLVKKVAQVLKRKEVLSDFLDRSHRIEQIFDIKKLAKEIVEFLGIKEQEE